MQELCQLVKLVKLRWDVQEQRDKREELRRASEIYHGSGYGLVKQALLVVEGEITRLKYELEHALDIFIKMPHGLFQTSEPTDAGAQLVKPGDRPKSKTLPELDAFVCGELEAINKDLVVLDSAVNDYDVQLQLLDAFREDSTQKHEASSSKLEDLKAQLEAEIEKRVKADEEDSNAYGDAITHMGGSVDDLKNTMEELRADFENLKGSSHEDQFTSQGLTNLETRLGKLDSDVRHQVTELTGKGDAQDKDIKIIRSRLEQAIKETGSIEVKLKGVEAALATGSHTVGSLEQSVASCQKELKDVQRMLVRAREEEQQRKREDREEQARLQQSHDALQQRAERRDAEFQKLAERVLQLEGQMNVQANRSSVLMQGVDKLIRNSDPRTDAFFRQVEERIKAEFLPDLLLKILRRQEENVYGQLSARLDPILQFVQELHQLSPLSSKARPVHQVNPQSS